MFDQYERLPRELLPVEVFALRTDSVPQARCICIVRIERLHTFGSHAFTIGPYVILSIGIRGIRLRLPKPWMIVTRVIGHQIENEKYTSLVAFVDETPKIIHGAVVGMNARVIFHVVFMVGLGRMDGHQPDQCDTQFSQVIEFLSKPIQVTNAVSVGVEK